MLCLGFPALAHSQELPESHHSSVELDQAAANHNRQLYRKQTRFGRDGLSVFPSQAHRLRNGETIRPFTDYEQTGIVAFSFEALQDSLAMKENIATHLPEDVKLLITVRDDREAEQAVKKYSQYISIDRILTVNVGNGTSFWSRDALPYPVIRTQADGSEAWSIVDAKYYPSYSFEPDAEIGKKLRVPVAKHDYIHFGGNLIANKKGNCFRIDSDRGKGIPFEIFEKLYGCRTLVAFPHRGGIGDIDERIKFLSDEIAVTDTPEYIPTLTQAGFQVTVIPKPSKSTSTSANYRTYANALLVNGVLFLPIFGSPEDAEAIRIYESLGVTVRPALTPRTSDINSGNVHCFTMNYPAAL
jgi:hypothetical protein